jgi:hypothetical protein
MGISNYSNAIREHQQMYLQNKYTRWYYSIINHAQSRPVSGYTENHHIIPRSFGGTNSKDNLVTLTAREHFICHLLLTRMTQGQYKKKMVSAVFYLIGRGKANRNNQIKSSRLYQNLKQQLSAIVSEQKKGCKQPPRSDLARQRYSNSKAGKNNPNHKGYYITPWGTFESSRMAAKMCPVEISAPGVANLCERKNLETITYLSVCRSKAYLKEHHIGKTPAELGFAFHQSQV